MLQLKCSECKQKGKFGVTDVLTPYMAELILRFDQQPCFPHISSYSPNHSGMKKFPVTLYYSNLKNRVAKCLLEFSEDFNETSEV